MTNQTLKLGKLESVHGIASVYLQRAIIVIALSFIFFLVMLIAFTARQQVGYFLLATAFLIVKLFTLFGFMSQRKKAILLYENGFVLGKQICFYNEIKEISLKQAGKNKGEIIKNDGGKIVLPGAIDNINGIMEKIDEKVKV